MPGIIPQNKVDEIRLATDIFELISGYVTLKRKGQNYFGLCPFHNEKTPSFSVNPDKQIFHCFGCGAGGNAFTFLMRHEGISFPESVKMLAQRANILLEWDETELEQVKQNEGLYYVCEFASAWFHELLFSSVGKEALAYLNSRGLSEEVLKQFELGVAPNSWDGLIKQAQKTANSVDNLLAAGLVLEKEGGSRYDRFRNRITFPIKNLSGRVVAFGGRVIKNEPNSPKYINSPETPIYEKSKVLYGLFQGRDAVRREDCAIFVEGYMDVISLSAGGVRNVVATSGTSLTQQQAALIRRYTRRVVLMYDSDTAGSAATLRGADILIENDLEVFIATLPAGHDPDSFIQEHGKDAVLTHVEQARSLFEYKVSGALEKPPEKRRDDIHSLLRSAAKIKDQIQRSLVVSKAAEQLQISEKHLWAELQSLQQRDAIRPAAARPGELAKTEKRTKREKAIEDLLRVLLHEWNCSELVFNSLELNMLREHQLFPVFEFLANQFKGGRQPTESELLHHFTSIELSEFITREINNPWQGVDTRRWAKDCLVTLALERVQFEIDQIREQLKQNQNDMAAQKSLLAKCMELENQKKSLTA